MAAEVEINTKPILDTAELERAMNAHGKIQPNGSAELARWWYRTGELWASFGVIERRCNGSTIHAFEKARAQYVAAGDLDMARVCGELVEAHTRAFLR